MLDLEIITVGAEWNPLWWEEQANEFEKAFRALLEKWLHILIGEAKKRAPKDTGQLEKSIYGYLEGAIENIVLAVGSDLQYALYQEFGTGIYGEGEGASGEPIKPKSARALKIPIGKYQSVRSLPASAQAFELGPGKQRAGTGFIFRDEVLGVKPHFFISSLIEDYEEAIVADVEQLLERFGSF